MEVNISLEDLFGDSIREMRERDKAFLPEPEWFSRIETDLDTFMQTYMTKYPFTSFEAIPGTSRASRSRLLRTCSFICRSRFAISRRRLLK